MSNLSFLLGGLLISPLLPLLYWQGKQARRRIPAPVLPQGDTFGTFENGSKVLNLLVIGESTVAGVGVAHYGQSIAAQVAEQLSQASGLTVAWRAVGKNGATAATARQELLPQIDPVGNYQLVVVLLGANDSMKLSSPSKWQKDLRALVLSLRERCPEALIYAGAMPPVHCFFAIPQPARFVLGTCSRLLAGTTPRALNNLENVIYSRAMIHIAERDFFSHDGIHPSEKGYRLWAQDIVKELGNLRV